MRQMRGLTRSNVSFDLSSTLRRQGMPRIAMRFILGFFFFCCTYMFKTESCCGMNGKSVPKDGRDVFSNSRAMCGGKVCCTYSIVGPLSPRIMCFAV